MIAMMIEAVNVSEKSVNCYQAARRNIPEDIRIHTRHLENLEYHTLNRSSDFILKNSMHCLDTEYLALLQPVKTKYVSRQRG
jgi:hypothetical protein